LKHIKLNESKTLRTFEYGFESLDLRETRELTERQENFFGFEAYNGWKAYSI
jgi:hypothetical protein